MKEINFIIPLHWVIFAGVMLLFGLWAGWVKNNSKQDGPLDFMPIIRLLLFVFVFIAFILGWGGKYWW